MSESRDTGARPEGRSSQRTIAGGGRNFLLLQGPAGTFFARLALGLRRHGHRVHRIHFNGGDRLFWPWRDSGAVDYRQGPEQWPDFLNGKLRDWSITDLVLFGDCRPLHRAAVAAAGRHGIAVHVFEEGYLRPNWLTLEQGGVNRLSSLPRDPGWYLEQARQLPPWHPGTTVPSSFPRRAAADVAYNLGSMLLRPLYPGYRSHKPWHALVEYRAGARRFFGKPAARRRDARHVERLLASARPYHLFPLQLEADAQIRFHSDFGGMAPAITRVLECFARHAAADALLVVTEHPLDSGVIDLGVETSACAARLGISERVLFLQGGSPDALLRGSRGVVTVNSTLALLALGYGVAVKVLGHAVYDLPGLTDQQPLERFWTQAAAPDPLLFDAFRRVLVARAQINGGLYSRAGLELATAAGALKLCQPPEHAPYGLRHPRAEAATPLAAEPCAPGGNFGLYKPQ